MKTNKSTQKKRAVKRKPKKAIVNPFTEIEGKPYNGLPVMNSYTLGKSQWNESRRGQKSWDITFETIALKSFENNDNLPIGSEHHSFVLAHQKIVKTRKNTFSIKLEGIKHKLAHKQAGENWNANAMLRKQALIKLLKETLHELEMGHGQAPSQTPKSPTPTKTGE